MRLVQARLPTVCVATATFAAALTCSGFASAASDTALPASATAVRNAIVAMTLADAALPAAVAVSGTRDDRPGLQPAPLLPASSVAMKPETSAAMASMKSVSGRTNAGVIRVVSYDRRVRTYAYPFPLILGIAY